MVINKLIFKDQVFNIFQKISSQKDLKIIEEKTISANNLKELLDLFKFIRSLNLQFKNVRSGILYMCFVGLVFLIGGGLFATSIGRVSFDKLGRLFWINFTFIVVAIINGMFVFRKINYTKKISDLIVVKKAALDNNLTFDKSDKKELLQSLEEKFFIFHQGNHSRELIGSMNGEYKNKLAYNYFKFHYIDEDTSTSTDANGNSTSNTTYHHYDLYGLIVKFNTQSFIKISNHDKVVRFKKFIHWKTGSISFNKKFKVYTNDEKAIAFFLQPKVIEQIEKLYETFSKIDIEISPEGLLALSTPDQDLLNHKRYYGVDQLDLFKEEIKTILDQTKLYKALDFINFLKNYHEIT